MAALACVPAAAQRNDSIAEGKTLTGVTITENARRNSVSATAPVRLLDSEAMLRLGVTDIADALHRLPGVTLRDYGGGGGMKTVAVRGFGAQHTGVSYDGLALSDCQTGEIDVSRYSIENAASIALTIGDNEDIFIPARNAAFASMLSINTMLPPSADLKPHVTAQIKFWLVRIRKPVRALQPQLHRQVRLLRLGRIRLCGERLSVHYTQRQHDHPRETHQQPHELGPRRGRLHMEHRIQEQA